MLDTGSEITPYVVGTIAGTLAFIVVTPVVRFPPSYPLFAIQSLAIIVIGAFVGYSVTAQYLGSEN